MTTSYKTLLQQKAELDAQIAETQKREKADAVQRVRAIVDEYQLSEADVFAARKSAATAGIKVSPKYRDAATGATWTGRGKPPQWIAGQDRTAFLI